ncbi:MAG TPA: ACT domain-containing protein [Planctomycetaceae bacterium]|nr:ACT domain-containing protein [Planctomycetaceae bacterium]
MAITVTKVDVWTTEIPDQPGGLSAKLDPLAKAGVNLDFVMARRQPDKPGSGVAFAVGMKGAKGAKVATAASWQKSETIGAVRVDGGDKPGACHKLLQKLAAANINLRGMSASVIGKKFVTFLAFDSIADAAQAAKLLKK